MLNPTLKLHVGVVLKTEQTIVAATDSWLHTVSFDLPQQQFINVHDPVLINMAKCNDTMANTLSRIVNAQRQHLLFFCSHYMNIDT